VVGIWKDRRGASAVEFALIAPFLLLLVGAILAYGSIFATSLSVQQIAAETARATIGGLSDGERKTLADAKLASIASKYPMLDPARMTFVFNQDDGDQLSRLTFSYDMSSHPAYVLDNLLPLPESPLSYSMIITDGDGADT
jgi:Flp pilus assembly protein TadG